MRRNQRERGQRPFPKFLWISHAVGGKFYKFVAQHHAEFGNPRLVIVSFVSVYYWPGDFKCPLNGVKQRVIGPTGWRDSMFSSHACQAGVLKLSVTGLPGAAYASDDLHYALRTPKAMRLKAK